MNTYSANGYIYIQNDNCFVENGNCGIQNVPDQTKPNSHLIIIQFCKIEILICLSNQNEIK